jgi:hypothetical protein
MEKWDMVTARLNKKGSPGFLSGLSCGRVDKPGLLDPFCGPVSHGGLAIPWTAGFSRQVNRRPEWPP